MEINAQNYSLEQDGKIYNISTQIIEDKLRLICEETNTEHPLSYFAEFTLMDLVKLSSSFSKI